MDVGFSPAEARSLRLRSRMVTELLEFLEKQGLTSAQAAKRLHVPLGRMQDLLQGNIGNFSIDELVNMFAEAGLEVDFRIRKKPAA